MTRVQLLDGKVKQQVNVKEVRTHLTALGFDARPLCEASDDLIRLYEAPLLLAERREELQREIYARLGGHPSESRAEKVRREKTLFELIAEFQIVRMRMVQLRNEIELTLREEALRVEPEAVFAKLDLRAGGVIVVLPSKSEDVKGRLFELMTLPEPEVNFRDPVGLRELAEDIGLYGESVQS